MYQIAVVEDDAADRERLVTLLRQQCGAAAHITVLDPGFEPETCALTPDILFLDVLLGTQSGILIAETANKLWPRCQVIFVTGRLEYAPDLYQARHLCLLSKTRLEELERRKAELEERIEAERCDLAEISRDDILRGLRLFRKGDIADRRYIARLFDTFLLAVYLYDDRFRLVFSFDGTGKPKKSITVPMDTCSYDDSFEPPKETRKNFRVYVNKDLYILEVPYRE